VQFAAHLPRELARDVQAESGAARGGALAFVAEIRLEQVLGLVLRQADAVIAHHDGDGVRVLRVRLDLDPRPRRRVLQRVRDEVRDDLHRAIAVAPSRQLRVDARELEDVPGRPREHRHALEDFGEDRRDRKAVGAQFGATGANAADVEQLFDEAREAFALTPDDLEELHAVGVVELALVAEQDLRERSDRGERRAELVRDDGDELVARLVDASEFAARAGEVRGALAQVERQLLAVARRRFDVFEVFAFEAFDLPAQRRDARVFGGHALRGRAVGQRLAVALVARAPERHDSSADRHAGDAKRHCHAQERVVHAPRGDGLGEHEHAHDDHESQRCAAAGFAANAQAGSFGP